jgi:hypothetical protein
MLSEKKYFIHVYKEYISEVWKADNLNIEKSGI